MCEKLVLKTNKLKKYDAAYPRISSSDFYERVAANWEALQTGNVNGQDSTSTRLQKQIHGRKFNILTLWLYLCIERPWEKNWILPPLNEGMFTNIGGILRRLHSDFPQFPEIRTLRRQINIEDLKKLVRHSTFDPEQVKEVAESISNFMRAMLPKTGLLDNPNIKLLGKMYDVLSKEPHINRSALQRKLRTDKSTLLKILDFAESIGEINRIATVHNSEWIVYRK